MFAVILSALFPQEQEALTQSLENIGIKVKLDNLPSDQIFSSITAAFGEPTSFHHRVFNRMRGSHLQSCRFCTQLHHAFTRVHCFSK